MPTAPRPNALARLNALTGAPALLLSWVSVLWVGAGLIAADASHHDWLPERPILAAWWVVVALTALAHVASALKLRGATGTDDAATAPGDEPDEGSTLRVGAGVLTLSGAAALLGVLAPAAFGARGAAEVYASVDAVLAVLPGVGAACLVGSAAGLYVAEELPRAGRVLGVSPGTPAARAAQVISIALGAILFAVTMNLVSHFSVGQALVGAASGATP